MKLKKEKKMRLQGLIRRLQKIQEKHGNVTVGVITPEAWELGCFTDASPAFVFEMDETGKKLNNIVLVDGDTARECW